MASVLTQASEIKTTTLSGKTQIHAIGWLRAATQDLDQMRALNGLLLLVIALSVLPSSAGALELGPCEPAEAVKIIDTSLGQGKTLQQAMQMMIKAKVFDGSKACITFIRETSMSMRDSYPRAFKSLWLN